MSEPQALYELAVRNKFRFQSRHGLLTTEQLYDMPLTGVDSIDKLAVALNDEIQKSSTKSFVSNTTSADKVLQAKFDLVKHIISVRVEERNAAAAQAEKRSKRKLLDEAIAEQENQEFISGSIEELKKRRAELDD